MTKTNWTPGPWHVNGTKSIRGPRGEYIAKAHWLNGSTDAHLIAAAPDLYAALEATLTQWVDLAISGDAGLWDPEAEDHVIAARAALAKARGEA